jgi:hypothetical protein
MQFSRLFLLISIFLLGSISTNSYANVVYQDTTVVETVYPVDKKSPVKKKKKKFRKKIRKKALFRAPEKVNETQDFLTVIVIVLALILLLPVIFIIVGGLTGGLGWFIAGAILMGLWLITGYSLGITRSVTFGTFGLIICLVLFLACLAFFFWALIVSLPLLFTLSIVFGSIALIGFLLSLFLSVL